MNEIKELMNEVLLEVEYKKLQELCEEFMLRVDLEQLGPFVVFNGEFKAPKCRNVCELDFMKRSVKNSLKKILGR